ncbi:MAG: efflux RND transporter periplasmic adaptor subunit [Acidobacteria bacterium]|nr:efflux RND transporter periplasmic adaptor subunit [Acidobacteriota bacterium]
MRLDFRNRLAALLVPPLAAGLLFAGCSRDKAASSSAGSKGAAGGATFSAPPVPVEVLTVQTRDVQYSISAVGSLQAQEVIRVPARVPGVIQDIAFHEGDWVTPDRVLARIDPERYRLAAARAAAALQEAEAKANEAKAALDKRQALRAKDAGWVTLEELTNFQAQMDQAVAAAAALKAAKDQAVKDAHDSEVRAEIAGVIDQKQADTGQYLAAGTAVATMLDARKLKLSFRVAESDAARLGKDPGITFQVKGVPGKQFHATLFHVGGTSDPGTRMVECLAWVENADRELRPGNFADVTVALETRKGSLVVPQTAVLPTDRGFVGFVLKDDTHVEKRLLRLGLFTQDGSVEVLEGLQPGDRVIVRGSSTLSEDSIVTQQAPEATP